MKTKCPSSALRRMVASSLRYFIPKLSQKKGAYLVHNEPPAFVFLTFTLYPPYTLSTVKNATNHFTRLVKSSISLSYKNPYFESVFHTPNAPYRHYAKIIKNVTYFRDRGNMLHYFESVFHIPPYPLSPYGDIEEEYMTAISRDRGNVLQIEISFAQVMCYKSPRRTQRYQTRYKTGHTKQDVFKCYIFPRSRKYVTF